jgi:hypothetical protein
MSSYLTKENPQELSQNHICSVKTREQSDQGTSSTLWEGGYSQVQPIIPVLVKALLRVLKAVWNSGVQSKDLFFFVSSISGLTTEL